MKLTLPAKRKLNTLRLHKLERATGEWPTLWTTAQPLQDLETLVRTRYIYYGGWNDPPVVHYGPGYKQGNRRVSKYDKETHRIELARGERNRLTAVHNLIHSLGYKHHNKQFVDLWIEILYFEGLEYPFLKDLRTRYVLP